MNLAAAFPLVLWFNQGKREDLRNEMEARLAEAGIEAERFRALGPRPPGSLNGTRGWASPEARASALTLRMALREALRRGAPAVLLLGDDVMFHPNFQALVKTVELPEDWGIFYLGSSHRARPVWAGSRVVRCTRAAQPHGVAIRVSHFRRVIEALGCHCGRGEAPAEEWGDVLEDLQCEIPTYSACPNLVWADPELNHDKTGSRLPYTADGAQTGALESVKGLWDEVFDEDRRTPAKKEKPTLALLFLTRGDVHHPRIWREFVSEAPGRVRVLSHSKFQEQCIGGFLEGTGIGKRFATKWGDISLVKASRELLLEALEDRGLTHFVLLSESCVPVRPLPEILRRLELDPRPQFDFRGRKTANHRHLSRIGAVPEVPPGCWRFTSQWWLMDRTAAILAASQDYTPLFEKMVVPDEAYFATVLCMQGFPLEGAVVKREVTWTHWEKNAGSPTEWEALPLGCLEDLLQSGAMFARKFPPGADIGKLGLHRSPERQSQGA